MIDIHYNNKEKTEMTVYLNDENKTYFLSKNGYQDQLRRINCKYAERITKAIEKFLTE